MMNYALLENVQALLDYQTVPKNLEARIAYLSNQCGLAAEAARDFLLAEQNLPNGEVRKIADIFQVDLKWLVGKG